VTKSFRERLDAIERQLRQKPGAGMFTILEISGGLPGPVNYARAGDHSWERADGEEFEAFVQRAALAAFNDGQMGIVVGGLPRADEYQQYRLADGSFDFDRWWQEVAAPHYPEVPNPEPVGYRRPSRACLPAPLGVAFARPIL
jgi:hypothetical protein